MDHDEVRNMTLLPREIFSSEGLADLYAAVVAAGGDEMDYEQDGKENDDEDGGPDLRIEGCQQGRHRRADQAVGVGEEWLPRLFGGQQGPPPHSQQGVCPRKPPDGCGPPYLPPT